MGNSPQSSASPPLFLESDRKIIAQHANTGNFNGLGEEFDARMVKLPSEAKKTLKAPLKSKNRDPIKKITLMIVPKPKKKVHLTRNWSMVLQTTNNLEVPSLTLLKCEKCLKAR